MSRTLEDLLFMELTHFSRRARRYLRGDSLSPDAPPACHDRQAPPELRHPHGSHGGHPFPHGHRSPVLARERILTVLLEKETGEQAGLAGDLPDCTQKSENHEPELSPQVTAGLRQKQLTEAMRINASSMSEFIGHLESDGYVERNVDPSDKRATLITLTEKGRARACELQDERSEKMASLFAPLTEEERRELMRLLKKLQKREE